MRQIMKVSVDAGAIDEHLNENCPVPHEYVMHEASSVGPHLTTKISILSELIGHNTQK